MLNLQSTQVFGIKVKNLHFFITTKTCKVKFGQEESSMNITLFDHYQVQPGLKAGRQGLFQWFRDRYLQKNLQFGWRELSGLLSRKTWVLERVSLQQSQDNHKEVHSKGWQLLGAQRNTSGLTDIAPSFLYFSDCRRKLKFTNH